MSISILQKSKNFTVYPEIPLQVVLPNAVTAGSYLVVVVFGHRTPNPFNTNALSTVTVHPVVYDDMFDTFTLIDDVVNLYQELSVSPPIAAPDASGYFPSVYTFVAKVVYGSFSPPVYSHIVTVTDPGLAANSSPPISSPPYALGRPIFDGGLEAVVFEIAGLGTGVTAHGNVTGDGNPLGHGLVTPGSTNSLVLEIGILMDSTTISPAPGSVSPPLYAGTIQYTDSYPAGSSSWIIQSTLQTTARTSSGFLNPIEYAGGVVALVLK